MAGKLLGRFLNFIGLEAEEPQEDYFEGEQVQEFEEVYQEPEELSATMNRGKRTGRVVNMPTPAPAASMKMMIYQPASYEETQRIIDNLRTHRPVVVNLESLETEVSQRVLDFMSGAVYALSGSIHKVSRGIFILAPSNVDISGNVSDEMRGRSYYTASGRRGE